jgi:hypothetical protein
MIPQQPILKKPLILVRVSKETKNYFEIAGVFLSIKEEFLGVGNLNLSISFRDKRG